MTETNRIEFKRELTRELDIEKEVVAFLNYREGGIIYIGVDDAGKPVGVQDIDGDMLKIKDRIRMGISPSPMGLFDVTVERIDDVPVIKIFVASGSEKPYYKNKYGLSEKGCFIRVGSAAEPMTQGQIEDLYAHRVRNSLRNIRSPRKSLTFRQLHIYYESQGLKLNEHFMENLDLLTDTGEPNYVAYLLADENSTSIKVAKYAGTDRDVLIANNELGYCSLLKATDNVLDKLHVENNVSSEITYKRRIDSPLWDERAMREIVINAIVHNDYYTNEVPPKFEIFSDRIEKYIPPKKGRKHILYIIRELLDFKPESKKTDIGMAVSYFTRMMKRRTTAFLLSDFYTRNDFTKELQIANSKHDVVAVQVYDPRAKSLPDIGLMKVRDAETGHEMIIDTSSSKLRKAHTLYWLEREDALRKCFNKSKVDWTSVATNDDYVRALMLLFKQRS